MAKITKPKGKISRRLKLSIHPKGQKVLQRRSYAPGMHGPTGFVRLSEYGKQLHEKQKARHLYGVMEKQFVRYYREALKMTGNTGVLLMKLLEKRLDNVAYRMGLAKTRPHARQLVNHGHILVNGKKMNIPSYRVKIGDIVSVKPSVQKKDMYMEFSKAKPVESSWFVVDQSDYSCKIISEPGDGDVEVAVDPKLIVEFYSR